jgi:hypothetical protein
MAGYSGRCNTQNFWELQRPAAFNEKTTIAGKYTQQQKDGLFVVVLGRVRGGALTSRCADTKFAY